VEKTMGRERKQITVAMRPAAMRITRLTGSATMITTCADAIGTMEIAVERAVTSTNSLIVRTANAWIRQQTRPSVRAIVEAQITKVMATATTTTTTVAAIGIKVTVVGTRRIKTKRSTAKYASVWTPKTRPTRQRRQRAPAHAVIRLGRAMVFATVATIIAAVNTTKAIVVALRAIRISTNIARKTVSASTLLRKNKNLECHSGKRYTATVSSVDFLQPYI
jgi:hypothetical protein